MTSLLRTLAIGLCVACVIAWLLFIVTNMMARDYDHAQPRMPAPQPEAGLIWVSLAPDGSPEGLPVASLVDASPDAGLPDQGNDCYS